MVVNDQSEQRSLTDRSLDGMIWVGLDKIGGSGVNFLITILLARLLFPADFGVVAMAMVVFELSSVFVESGFSTALIRERNITEDDKSTTYLFNLVVAFVLYGVLFLCAPWIAVFFDEPVLTAIVRVLGLNLILEALTIVQTSSLIHRVDFKTQAKARFGGIVVSGAIGVALALLGAGVWALVARLLINAAVLATLLWRLDPWKPRRRFNMESFRRLFGFGSRILMAALLDKFFGQAYKLVIGKFFAANVLGFYGQAAGLVNMVINTLFRTVQTVSYPVLAKLQDDHARLKNAYRMILRLSSFAILPMLVLLGVLAEPITITLLGDKWAPSVFYLQLLCVAGVTYHISSVNLNVLLVLGRSDLSLRLEVVKKVNIAVGIAVGIGFGIRGLVVGEVIVAWVNLLINAYYSERLLRYTPREQVMDVAPTLLLSACMGGLVHVLYGRLPVPGPWNLMAIIAAGGIAYLALHRLVGSQEWRMLTGTVLPRAWAMITAARR